MCTEKQKLYFVVIIATLGLLLVSCSAVISPLPVGLFSSAKFPLDYESGYNGNTEYKILGDVEGKSTATSIFGLFATGDASISTALSNAVSQYPEADGLIEICIDYQTSSFLGIFASMTTIVKGKAIQFQKELTSISSGIISSDTLSEKELKYSTVSLEDEFENWKKEILTYKDLQLKMKWKSFAKRNSIDVPWEEWVNSLSKSEYEAYLRSNLKVRKWLGQRLEENKEIEQVSQVAPGFDNLEFIGKWKLILTKSKDGKVVGSESGLKGSLILAEDKNVKLMFDQSGKKVEFEGKFYYDDKGSMVIEVQQIGTEALSKIFYKSMLIKDSLLILTTETGREYHWKK